VDKKECLLCAKVKSLTSIARECWEGVWECDNKLLLSCFVCFFRVKVVEGMNTRIETLYVKHDMMDGWMDRWGVGRKSREKVVDCADIKREDAPKSKCESQFLRFASTFTS
jgi:hypothetical protein